MFEQVIKKISRISNLYTNVKREEPIGYTTYNLPLLSPYSQYQISYFPVLSPQRRMFFLQSLFKTATLILFHRIVFLLLPSTSFTVSTALLFLVKIKVSRTARERANRGELSNLKEPPDLTQSQHSHNLTAFLSRYVESSKPF